MTTAQTPTGEQPMTAASKIKLSTGRAKFPARSATRQWADCNLSIHPSNWPGKVVDALGWTEREKRNTSAAPNPKTRKRLIAALTKHIERHPYDAASKARVAKLMES